ncbi:hypothetical protein VB636_15585, partial [Paracoccus sp. APAP_BH8]
LRDRRDFVGLDLSCRSLVEVRCENIGNLYFVNLDADAMPLRDYLGRCIKPASVDLSGFLDEAGYQALIG